jgi:hypothetical protein
MAEQSRQHGVGRERFDPRLTPARADLAAKHLEGKVKAVRFVEGRECEVIESQAPLRRAPAPDAPLESEALKGERVVVYEMTDEGWAWVQLVNDGYVGFMPASALGEPGPAPTHKVTALRTLAFPGPSIKLPPIATLAFGCRLTVARMEDPFAVTAAGQHLPSRHLAPVEGQENDFVSVAERFLGTPYLWGGKTNFGIDCSGLVQVSLAACGVACPRDSDMQEQTLGKQWAAATDLANLKRGDLLFWRGHVAIARDPFTVIHANAFHVAVATEPISEAIARILAGGCELTSVRRL